MPTTKMTIYAIALGMLITLPFLVLETVNGVGSSFPVALFAFIWLLSSSFAGSLLFLARSLRSGRDRSQVALYSSIMVVMVAGGLLLTILSDQAPCFIGVPNCD